MDKPTAAWRVMATTLDVKCGVSAIRPISRNYVTRESAEQYVELARATYPDAYLQEVVEKEPRWMKHLLHIEA